MAHYRFDSEWKMSAPIQPVFNLLSRPAAYSDWWPSVSRSELVSEGDDAGRGTRAVYSLRSPLGYSMTFSATSVEVEQPSRIQLLVRGDLIGTGTYMLSEDGTGTTVRLIWDVSTAKRWMNVLAPLARPLFVWAHHHVMREGAAAMASRLGARLISTRTSLAEATPVTSHVESTS